MKTLALLFFLFPVIVLAQMNGTYTVGGTSPDFQTVGEACDSIMSQGINGAVIINIRDGVYTNDSLHLANVTGTSSVNTITFQSESLDSAAVEINHSNSEVIFLKDSTCSYITIQHLTLIQNGSDDVIRMQNGSHHCEFNTLKLYRSVNGGMFYYSNSLVNPVASDIKIINSHYSSAPGLSSLSCIEMFGNNGLIDTVLIANNTFDFPLSTNGGDFAGFEEVSNIEIKDNYVSGDFSTGIYPQFASGQNTISGNELYFYDGGVFALDFSDCDGDFLVTNNLIRTGNGVYTFGTSGMSINAMSGTVEIYNNTFYVDEKGIDVNDSDSVLSYNNLIYVNSQGPTTNTYGVYVVQNSNFYSDYNAFYSNVNFAEVSGSTYTDLPSYASATGNDANSFLLFDPMFYDDSLDLHVCSDSLIGSGDPSILLSVDVDGDLRSPVLPSIGADYFEPLVADFSFVQNGYDVQFTDASVWANDYLWDFGDGNTSTDANPLHTYASNGTYNMTLTVTNECETADTTITVGIAVGIDELSKYDLLLYPNPTNGMIQWESTHVFDAVLIRDASGRVILQLNDPPHANIDLSGMKTGLYLFEFQSGKRNFVKKVHLVN
ncbi:MAG: PKD domain-containing protein [Fluviicola sp.]